MVYGLVIGSRADCTFSASGLVRIFPWPRVGLERGAVWTVRRRTVAGVR